MIRAAVIGVGAMGRNHARVYNEMADVDLAGVADLDAAAARETARHLGTRAYADYQEMLRKVQPRILTVSVPTQAHCQVVLDSLSAGCHVLVEKPIAAAVEEAQTMINKARELGLVLAVGHIERYNPAVLELKRRLEAGQLGQVFQIRARRLGPFPARVRDVGVVVDLATHDLDIMRYLLGPGDSVQRLYAETEQRIHTAHEDLFSGMVRFQNGVLGLLDINWLTPTKIRVISVTGACGMVVAHLLPQDLYFYENYDTAEVHWSHMSLLRGVSEGQMIRLKLLRREPLRTELEALVAAAEGDPTGIVTGEDGLITLKMALKLVQAGRESRVIDWDQDQEKEGN